jgi:hypothetical protein
MPLQARLAREEHERSDMKITIDIDCTPAEARAFLGLPDVASLQAEMTTAMQERMMSALAAMDPETMMKMWLPGGSQAVEQMQKSFWEQLGAASRKGAGS